MAEESRPDRPPDSAVEEFNEKLSEAINTKLKGFSTFKEELQEIGASDEIEYVYISSLVKGNPEAEIRTFITGNPEKKIGVVMDVLEKAFGEKKVIKVLRARERRRDPNGKRMFA